MLVLHEEKQMDYSLSSSVVSHRKISWENLQKKFLGRIRDAVRWKIPWCIIGGNSGEISEKIRTFGGIPEELPAWISLEISAGNLTESTKSNHARCSGGLTKELLIESLEEFLSEPL